MALLGFQVWKADLVERGACRQTIRARRARPIRVGDRLVLARGVRTKNYRRIGEAVCTDTFVIQAMSQGPAREWVWLDITVSALDAIARTDGFYDWFEMTEWFRKNHKIKPNDVATFDVIRW